MLNTLREKKQILLYLLSSLGTYSGPPPHAVKISLLRNYGRYYRCSIFVETGTYNGSTLFALREYFDNLISMEIDETLHKGAAQRLKDFRNINLRLGECTDLLPAIIRSLDKRALFWLDAHYSGPGTGRGKKNDPIIESLECILSAGRSEDIIAIDDVRDFIRSQGEPRLQDIINLLFAINSNYVIRVKHDILLAAF